MSFAVEKITCRKFTGKYGDYNFSILFSGNGKMLIEVEEKEGGGYFSTPGSYSINNSKIDFFYRGLGRTIYIENDHLKASPYTFSINEDYKTVIILQEDKAYPPACK